MSDRASAIDLAFGPTFSSVQQLRIVLVQSSQWAEEHPTGDYESKSRTLIFRDVCSTTMNPYRARTRRSTGPGTTSPRADSFRS